MNEKKPERLYVPVCGHYNPGSVKIARKGKINGKRAVLYEIICKECKEHVKGLLKTRQDEIKYLKSGH